MTTIISSQYSINGIVSTDDTVLDNLNLIATAAGCWITYDVSDGKWSVIINRDTAAVATFTDNNILGGINISGSGITELYNSVSLEFNHKDLRNQPDYVDLKIPSNQLFTNELDNRLNISIPVINNPIQAQNIAQIELKQSRLDKIIEFRTDYSYLRLKAGDIIAVTSSIYGFTSKKFRIIKIEEDDSEGLALSIIAREHDASIYVNDLLYTPRDKKTRIIPRQLNEEITKSEDIDLTGQIKRMLIGNAALGIANKLLNKLFSSETAKDQNGNVILDENGNPVETGKVAPEDADADSILGGVKRPVLDTIAGPSAVCEGSSVSIIVGHSCSVCLFDIPPLEYDYEITGIQAADINIPLTGTVTVTNGTGALTFTPTSDSTSEGDGSGFETATVTIGGLSKEVKIYDSKDYTLTITRNPTNGIVNEGGSITWTVTATGSKINGTVGYTLTGTAVDRIFGVSTSGTLNFINASGTQAILTAFITEDSTYTGPGTLTLTVDPGLVDPCGTVFSGGDGTNTVTVLDNEGAPTTCLYVQIPVVWCAVYNGDDDQMYSYSVRQYAYLPVAQAGEATVNLPTSLTVTKGNPSTIAVATTTAIASSSSLGGVPIQVITSFNSVSPKGLITGTTTTVYGYLV